METRDLVALIGVTTGLFGALSALASSYVTILEHKRQGYIIKIRGRRGNVIIGGEPLFRKNDTYSVITIYNRGTRKASVSKAGERYLFRSGSAIYSNSMISGTQEVPADGALDITAEEKERVTLPKIGFFFAQNRSGKEFRHYPYTRMVFWLFYPLRKVDAFRNKGK